MPITGARPESAFDRASAATLFALYSLPTFWAALLLQTLFAVKLRWFPLYGTTSDAAPAGIGGLTDRLAHLALPVTCLTYGTLAFVAETPLGPVYTGLSLGHGRDQWKGKFTFSVGRLF